MMSLGSVLRLMLVRKSAVHHLHPVVIGFRLLLCPLLIRDGSLFLTGTPLDDAEDYATKEKQYEATNGTGDDYGASSLGKSVPAACHTMRRVELFQNRGVTTVHMVSNVVLQGQVLDGDLRCNLDALPASGVIAICVTRT
jgi:hypothetical protein